MIVPGNEVTEMHEREPEEAEHIHLPQPTIWPMVMGLGITVFASGLTLGPLVAAGGLVLFAWAVRGWIIDLIVEQEAAEEEGALTPVMEREERG